ncbi:MAG TPA: HlyD family efflux transporter periplasmic adaptor subunit [Coleofasciculaceae cyanobacterium]|jgi:multidrug resistance efflux pump
MPVKFEHNTQRKSERFQIPAEVIIGKARFSAVDWSFDGFSCMASSQKDLNTLGQYQGKVDFVLTVDGKEIRVPLNASAKWQAGAITGFQVTQIDDAGRQTLGNYCRAMLEGNLADNAGFFQQLQGQVKAAQPAKLLSDSERKTLNRKFVTNFLIYGLLLLMLVGTSLVFAYFNNFIVVTHKAILTADVTDVSVKLDGVVERVFVREGQQIQAGAPLYELDKDQVRREIQELQQSIEKQAAYIRLNKVQLQEARQAQGLYVQSARKDYQTLRARKDALAEATRQLEKEEALYANSVKLGGVSKLALEQKRSAVQVNRANMQELESELAFSGKNIQSARNGLYYTPSGIKGNTAEMEASITVQNKGLEELKARLNSLNSIQKDYVVKSPVSGHVVQVAPLQGQYAKAGTRIVSILPAQNVAHVVAVFPSSLEQQLRPGDAVEVYSTSNKKAMNGVVEQLFVEAVPTQIKPALNEIGVSIRLDDSKLVQAGDVKPFTNVLVRVKLNPFKGFTEKLGMAW